MSLTGLRMGVELEYPVLRGSVTGVNIAGTLKVSAASPGPGVRVGVTGAPTAVRVTLPVGQPQNLSRATTANVVPTSRTSCVLTVENRGGSWWQPAQAWAGRALSVRLAVKFVAYMRFIFFRYPSFLFRL